MHLGGWWGRQWRTLLSGSGLFGMHKALLAAWHDMGTIRCAVLGFLGWWWERDLIMCDM